MDKQDFIKWVRKLEPRYSSSPEVRDKLKNVDLIAIVGPTGVGKTTIINKLGLPFAKGDITRARRSDEGRDEYHFRSDYLEILSDVKEGKYVQMFVSGYDEFYGTRSDSYPEEGPCTMAVVAKSIKSFRTLGFRSVLPIYIMPPSYVEWMRRIGTMRAGEINQRIEEAIESIGFALRDDQYHFILNDDLDLAVKEVKNIINGERVDEHRARLARETADVLLEHLGDNDDDMYFSKQA